jgi:hypothetical protein
MYRMASSYSNTFCCMNSSVYRRITNCLGLDISLHNYFTELDTSNFEPAYLNEESDGYEIAILSVLPPPHNFQAVRFFLKFCMEVMPL